MGFCELLLRYIELSEGERTFSDFRMEVCTEDLLENSLGFDKVENF